MHVSSIGSGKEHLRGACSDLEKIRKLKKEAEFLEVSFRAKAASFQEVCFLELQSQTSPPFPPPPQKKEKRNSCMSKSCS